MEPTRIIAIVAVAMWSLSACGGGSGGTGDATAPSASEGLPDLPVGSLSEIAEADPIDVDDDLAAWTPPEIDAGIESVDRRAAVLSELGGPDAFVITVDKIDGEISRFETWSYFDARTQIDLVDGEVLWDMEIDGVPDGSYLPLDYSPMEFTMMASSADTFAGLDGVVIERVAADTDLDAPGTELWAGEQLLLAFVDDHLIYVETFPLAPVEPEVTS